MTEEEIAAYYDELDKKCGMNTDNEDTNKYWAKELKIGRAHV